MNSQTAESSFFRITDELKHSNSILISYLFFVGLLISFSSYTLRQVSGRRGEGEGVWFLHVHTNSVTVNPTDGGRSVSSSPVLLDTGWTAGLRGRGLDSSPETPIVTRLVCVGSQREGQVEGEGRRMDQDREPGKVQPAGKFLPPPPSSTAPAEDTSDMCLVVIKVTRCRVSCGFITFGRLVQFLTYIDTVGSGSPMDMEAEGPLLEDVNLLKRTVEEGATQVRLRQSVPRDSVSPLRAAHVFSDGAQQKPCRQV